MFEPRMATLNDDDELFGGLKSTEAVNIVYVQNHRTIFINTLSENEALCKLVDEASNYAKSAPPIQQQPKVGEILLAPFDEGKYY